ncbi:amidase [Sulfitobacter mediterraneus]|uniref:Amino acid/amide ABC transporter ATP-binding protein 2 (HAAT family) n=1 Tax=Sulfitobacter mediterraneus TaxID=83219 RepID=A0A2T6CA63_9RHOB|nr:amidase [Sulfitobacter mediterraneus]KIN78224.1 Amidase [Sulfitobacter mediterraneus KCTC 32188]PTX72109.1 amino acid/amide ABC transporter ATP-binding protein 2 (HAAT family) [Sulfitobacter mediterraneus]
MTEEREILLSAKGVSGGYGRVPILHGIDLDVAENEVVGVLGHNGMGKTTLLKTLMGFLPATAGQVRYDQTDITRTPPNVRGQMGIGYVPQGRGIFPQLSVRDNLRFAWHDHAGGTETEVMDAVLADFPRLQRLLDREGGALSGGEQQLLALARSLMGDPDFLLLDEPTEGIQPSIIEEMAETLLHLREQRGLSILLVEQNFDFIADLSDRVLVLERGRITGTLTRAELSDQAKVDQFLGFGAARGTRQTSGTRAEPPATAPAAPPTSRRPQTFPKDGAAKPSAPLHSQPNSPTVTSMTIKRPTLSQMRAMADRFGMSLSDEDLAEYTEIIEPYMQAYDRLDALPDNLPQVRYPRSPGYFPDQTENPLNAWYVKTEVRGAPDGKLRGKRIALKDTICLAGVPMMNGSSIMEGYTPEIDATIVTRMLDAGALIAGKAHCENFCLSGGSHTNAKGPIHNPWKRGYMAGGSSGGSAALVAAGEVDMAIAGDQGGSIRIPSSNCGVYGMKPTHGLVPYTGAMPIEQTIDHLGPVTNNVADNALLLEVLAGEDGLDPRQYKPKTYSYTESLGRGVHGMRIGILTEGFGHPNSESDVEQKVLAAAERFRELGARVDTISVPEHHTAMDAWTAITLEGLQDGMMWGNSTGTNYRGLFLPSMTDHMAQWKGRADELSHSLKACMFVGEHFQRQYRGRFYGKAQNIMRKVNERYHAALQQYDLLLMPTLPIKPQEHPPADCSLSLYVQRAFEMVPNTAPFNGGLPAMSIPCGLSEGLPIGMQLVGPNYGEMKIYQAAHAFEQSGDWRDM